MSHQNTITSYSFVTRASGVGFFMNSEKLHKFLGIEKRVPYSPEQVLPVKASIYALYMLAFTGALPGEITVVWSHSGF